MEEIVNNLSGIWYLATCEDDQPHVRPFDNACIIDNEIYIGTGKDKKVYDQIIKNQKIEVFAMTDFGPFRFMANAIPADEKTDEAFSKMGKMMNEQSVALKLTNITRY